jgi:hypothetical protein
MPVRFDIVPGTKTRYSGAPHDRFEAIAQKGADRTSFLGCHDASLSEKIRIELERDVGLHGVIHGST